MFKYLFFLIFLQMFFFDVFAADEGDFYLGAGGGFVFQKNSQAYANFQLGTVIRDEIGIGFCHDRLRRASQWVGEFRWMVEPVEIYSAFGKSFDWSSGAQKEKFLLTVGSTYLIPFFSQFSWGLDLKGNFLWQDKSRFFLGLRFRYLWEKI